MTIRHQTADLNTAPNSDKTYLASRIFAAFRSFCTKHGPKIEGAFWAYTEDQKGADTSSFNGVL